MKFETVKIGDNIHVSANGVISAAFARRCAGGGWAVLVPQIAYTPDALEDALTMIAADMDTWYTSAQAADRLVEMGAYNAPPSVHTMSNLVRAGAFSGAFKLRGKDTGGGGQGGSWRIPEMGLQAFAERRKRQ